jgi:chorismate synthase
LRERYGVEIVAWVSAVNTIEARDMTAEPLNRRDVDGNAIRCPDAGPAERMMALIAETAEAGDSLGGVVTCVCRGVPAGWGEPVFDKVDALLGHAMLSIPATKGIEIGSGFAATRMRGSEHNDMFTVRTEQAEGGGRLSLGTRTNRSGGIQGGITNGETIVFRVAFKPPATISKPQQSVDYEGRDVTLEVTGRHDPCVVPRAVPIVESMAALVLADLALQADSDGLRR